ncbi:MAG: hypothetical protein ACSHW7_03750 [Patiriisocius sp.]|uniref:hypothetical protein n=1 Tax=Patiriisocius sp. TaxID=2822396 RepID=UPI003EF1452B
MDNNVPQSTYIGIIAIAVTFLGGEIGLDYLMGNKATLEAKAWFAFLIIGLYFVIANQLYDIKNKKK